jgi:polar amino acid transport system permease protein
MQTLSAIADALQDMSPLLFNFDLLSNYGARLVSGVIVTFQVIATSSVLGFFLAYPICRARMSGNWLLSNAALSYVTFFRGTPLLCQLYLVYYGAGEIRAELTSVGLWYFFREAYFCCIFAFTLNTAAYQSEIMRGAISAVPKGQIEAAKALGLSSFTISRKIIFPQALLVAIRPMGNELITLIKASALAAIVTLLDLMGQTRFVFARTFDFSVYLYCAIIYLAITETIRRVLARIERAASRHLLVSSAPHIDMPRRRWLRSRGVETQTP